MPVEIRISINENVVETFHIGRLTKNGLSADSINEYAVVNKHGEPTNAEWDAAPRFEHRYGDDINTIALEALTRHQEWVSEQMDGGEPTPAVVPLPSAVRVAQEAVARINASRKCGYRSNRMLSDCILPYGHNGGHHS